MSFEAENDGLGQGTAPAFGIASRDFDGGLLARWQFTLISADALAWLRLRRDWSDRAKVSFGVACLAGGGLAGLLSGQGDFLWPFWPSRRP